MAQTIAVIEDSIKSAIAADPVIGTAGTDPLTSDSVAAVWLAWVSNISICLNYQQGLFDAHKEEVQSIIGGQQPHTLQWYATIGKTFQYGYDLPVDSDVYPVIDTTAQVVTNAVAVENNGQVRIKVAGAAGQLPAAQLTAFTAFMNYIKDAGVALQCTSGVADTLNLGFIIYYNPQVLNSAGARLDGSSNTPVQDAVAAFVGALPFNGVFVLNDLVAAIRAVDGVEIAQNTIAKANYGTMPFVTIAAYYVPDAGYLALNSPFFLANTVFTPYNY